MGKTKTKDPYKMTALQAVGWSGRGASLAVNVVILGYLTFFCTNMLGMSATTVGTLLLASKLFDGVTDLIAGMIIDKTNTRLGKARPYEFSILAVWICTILLYACPDLGMTGKCIWIFVMYAFVNSVFATLLNSSESVYLCRAFRYEEDRVKVASINGIVIMLCCTIVSVVFPILMGTLGTVKAGWIPMVAIIAVPFMLIGILRFLLVKETVVVDKEKAPQLKAVDFVDGLKSNIYIYILFGAAVLTFIASNIGTAVGSYYFTYIVGDIGKLSVIGLLSLATPIAIILMPVIMKKVSIPNLMAIASLLGAAGCLVKGFAGANMTLQVIGNLMVVISVLPMSYYGPLLVIHIMDYHEYKTGKRVEAVFGSIYGLATKIGSGLASGLVGVIMGATGFDGLAATQTDSALSAIVGLYGWIPGIMLLITAVLMFFFKLEKKLPEVHAELESRKTNAEQ